MQYLEFEKPIEELIIKLQKAKELGKDKSIDVSKTIIDIEKKIVETRKKIYKIYSNFLFFDRCLNNYWDNIFINF